MRFLPRGTRTLGSVQKARLCPHFLHPASPAGAKICPICVAVKLVPNLCNKLRILPPPFEGKNAKLARRGTIRKARIWVANYVNNCDGQVEKERTWEAEHRDVDVSMCNTAAMAAEMCRKAVDSLYDQDGEIPHPVAADTNPSTAKTVGFVLPKGEEKQTRQENGLFCRNHPAYERGKYAAPEGSEGWEDTSWYRDPSYYSPKFQAQLKEAEEGNALQRSLSKARDVLHSFGPPPTTPPRTPPKTPERDLRSVLKQTRRKDAASDWIGPGATPTPRERYTLYRKPTTGELRRYRSTQPGLYNRETFINTFSASNQPNWAREPAGIPVAFLNPQPTQLAKSAPKFSKPLAGEEHPAGPDAS
ncbi:uncharacterized protein BDZ99DRAFT_514143 [Mytilinidion resinicola]|uniref:Uncharacterized protein n=1 Tax=Mytilinidion resinicola TaxID=574789 RepID=A0A6A6ZA62_9PEZI|nr:uncharacterized protein BDZ99DRAFT_514143 [Mytilinidion resinicola]KAF2817920.1 hypothetical protein BDZ99DRAFT_514143 [Mytilinidion resinicola]